MYNRLVFGCALRAVMLAEISLRREEEKETSIHEGSWHGGVVTKRGD
jgi:hypothetical protein